MGNLRLAYRSLLTIVVLLIGIALAPFVLNGRMHRHGITAAIASTWHRALARALGIRVTYFGTPGDAATLYVANHISWFDIDAIGGWLPIRFLSKHEISRWPIIGWLATRAGTLYIKRGSHASQKAIDTMAAALRADQNVCLFPEGTTTDGNLRRFHARLMQSAIDAGSKIQPIAIYYPPEDHHQTPAHCDILYIGNTSIAESLLQVLRSPRILAEIHLLEPIEIDDMDRKEIAQVCETAIRTKLLALAGGTE